MPKSTPKKLAYMREYRLKNADSIHRKLRAYYWANHEKMLAYQKEYRKRRRESMTDEEREEYREYQRTMYQLVYKERRHVKKEK